MQWNKKGRIFYASGQYGWMQSHTQVPTALVLEDRIRIFFATRAADGRSRPGFIDVDLTDPSQILYLHNEPILELGDVGMFDEDGVIPNHVFRKDYKLYLFYVGWSRLQTIPYCNWTGLAVSDDNGMTFKRAFKGPILDRTPDELYSATGLICLEHNNLWHGWYAAGLRWLEINNRLEHTYQIRASTSPDLINWTRSNQSVLPTKLPNESNTRPTVIFEDQRWHMWFCYRGTQDFRDGHDSYRIGYAWSTNLSTWVRADAEAGITVASEGWDSKMICYPCVVQVEDRRLMFYCGNGFGREGFGYAELEPNSVTRLVGQV